MNYLNDKNILIISPDSWDFLPVSKHHYAIELAKTNHVYFLNPPSEKKGIFLDKGVNVINDYKRIQGINKIPFTFIKRFLMKVEIKSILKKTSKNKIDIVWSFDTSRLYFLDLFKAKLKIAHIVDLSENFYFKDTILSANYCFCVSESIKNKIITINKNVYKINHGYNDSVQIQHNETVDNQGVYFGNLNMLYIDWESIYLIVDRFQNITFKFYGNHDLNLLNKNIFFEKFSKLKNVSINAPVSPEEMQKILKKSRFALVSYLHLIYGKQVDNSHKIMQYLGSGIPIFSSFTYEYRNYKLFPMFYTQKEVVNLFEQFINNEFNDFTEDSKNKRINFALENTYSKQIERIEKIILKK